MRRMRLDRLLARGGASRREAAALVKSGRVTVNGRTASDPAMALDLDADSAICYQAGNDRENELMRQGTFSYLGKMQE